MLHEWMSGTSSYTSTIALFLPDFDFLDVSFLRFEFGGAAAATSCVAEVAFVDVAAPTVASVSVDIGTGAMGSKPSMAMSWACCC